MTHDALAPDVDPDIKVFVATTGAAYGRYPDFSKRPFAEQRRICEEVRAPWVKGGPQLAKTFEMQVPARSGPVRVRVHDPLPGQMKPAFVYLHGGGWTVFSLDTHDRLMREYAARAQVAVIGVDYALSPEAKFPFALEQVCDVIGWLGQNGRSIEVDAARLAVGGDSAGGSLTLGACLMLRDTERREAVRAMVLNYGFFDLHISPESAARYGGPGYMLTVEECVGFYKNYLTSDADLTNPLTRPLHADVHGLPQTLLVVPECDVLTEQSLALAQRLARAGVAVESREYKGATHSFLEAVSIAPLADRAIAETAAWLQAALRT